MDDMIYVEQMGKAYLEVDKANKEIDDKASNMLMVICAMFSLQTTLLVPTLTYINQIISVIGVLFYIISAILFLKILLHKEYKVYPNTEKIVDFYEYDYSKEEYVAKVLGNYVDTINFNTDINLDKSKYGAYAFHCLIIGIIISFISVFIGVL